MAEEVRPLRGCEVCGEVDDHPRVQHDFMGDPRGVTPDDVMERIAASEISYFWLREHQNPATQIRHHDCCVQAGCPDGPNGACAQIAGAAEGKTGSELLGLINERF